jgi:hypothetical protein
LAWAGATSADDHDLNGRLHVGRRLYRHKMAACLADRVQCQSDGTSFFATSNDVAGVITFSGDGTGMRSATALGIAPPPNGTPSAALAEFTPPFLYSFIKWRATTLSRSRHRRRSAGRRWLAAEPPDLHHRQGHTRRPDRARRPRRDAVDKRAECRGAHHVVRGVSPFPRNYVIVTGRMYCLG